MRASQVANEEPVPAAAAKARRELRVLLLTVVVALVLRLFRLGHQSLWTDEIVSALSSGGTMWWVLTQTTVNSNIPPLYYALLHAVMSLSRDEWALRLPSVLAGVASLPLFFLSVRELLGGGTALAGAALLATSPFHVWYSQEARPYALLVFLSLLAFRLLQLLIRRPGHRGLQVGFALSAASMFYCHSLGLPFIAFLLVYALRETPHEKWAFWARLFAVICILLAPAFYRLIVFAPSASADASRALSFAFVPYVLWAFATGYSIGPTLTELHLQSRVTTTFHFLPIILPIAVVIAVVGTLGAFDLWKRERATFSIVVLWFVFPLAFALLGTLATQHPFNVRYVILSLPPFFIAVAAGVLAPKPAIWRFIAVTAWVVISAFSLSNYFFVSRYYREDNRAAAAFLAANADSGAFVVADAPYTASNLEYYARRPDLTIFGYPPQERPAPGATGVLRRSIAEGPTRAGSGGTSGLASLVASRDRFWIFLSRTYHGLPARHVLEFCDRRFRRLRQLATDNDILLILYERQPQARFGMRRD